MKSYHAPLIFLFEFYRMEKSLFNKGLGNVVVGWILLYQG
jgi:uncharacterized membrane protein YGL010W